MHQLMQSIQHLNTFVLCGVELSGVPDYVLYVSSFKKTIMTCERKGIIRPTSCQVFSQNPCF